MLDVMLSRWSGSRGPKSKVVLGFQNFRYDFPVGVVVRSLTLQTKYVQCSWVTKWMALKQLLKIPPPPKKFA